jgi:drug/metabolite transporter (DMT)-like permease
MNAGVKMLSGIPPIEIVFFRSLITFIISLSVLRLRNVYIFGKKENRKILLTRGLAGAVALTLYYYTLQVMPLASAVTIQFISPIFTAILGIFIVKEKVSPLQWLFFLISFAGVIIIQGVDTRISTFYLIVGIFAALFSGLAYNMIRKLSTSENPMVIIFYFPLVTLPLSGIVTASNWVSPRGWDWLIILFVGVSTQIAQYFMTKAFQREELAKISSIRYMGIVYALIFGFVLFGESFTIYSYMGMALVLFGVFLNIRFRMKSVSKKKASEEPLSK